MSCSSLVWPAARPAVGSEAEQVSHASCSVPALQPRPPAVCPAVACTAVYPVMELQTELLSSCQYWGSKLKYSSRFFNKTIKSWR